MTGVKRDVFTMIEVKVSAKLPDGTTIRHIRYTKKGWYAAVDSTIKGPICFGPYDTYEDVKEIAFTGNNSFETPVLVFEVL